MAPTWDQLSEQLAEQHADKGIVIAKVDMTTNPGIQDRFDIQGYPTLKFIATGKMYTYEGPRTLTDMMEFVLGGYKNASSIESVPPDNSKWKKMMGAWRVKLQTYDFARVTLQDFEHILHFRKNAALVLFLLGSSFGIVLGYVVARLSSNRSHSSKRTKKD